MATTNEQDQHGGVADVVTAFAELTEEEREEALTLLRDRFCLHCGAENPNCQCWNDE